MQLRLREIVLNSEKRIVKSDSPKFSSAWFSLQVSILNSRAMVAIFIISGNG